MASWVTHLMIADRVMKKCPELDTDSKLKGKIDIEWRSKQ